MLSPNLLAFKINSSDPIRNFFVFDNESYLEVSFVFCDFLVVRVILYYAMKVKIGHILYPII